MDQKTKLFSLLLSSIFICGSFSLNAFAAFSDVSSSHPNVEAITYVQAEGIVNGYPDGTFRPDQTINRAEFLKIVVHALVGQEPLEHAGTCFSDVASGVWFYPYVCYAQRMEFVGGYPDGSFKPEQEISFVEAAKIISIAYEYQTAADEIWFRPFVNALAERVAIPTSIDRFDKPLTRGEMAEMIYRLQANIRDKVSTNYDALSGKRSGRYVIDDTWDLYKHFGLGFEIKIPRVADVYNCETGGEFREIMKTFEDGNWVHIKPEHSYPWQNGCQKVTTTLSTIYDNLPLTWSIEVRSINNDHELDRFIKDAYGEGCTVNEKNLDENHQGLFNVTATGPGIDSPAPCFINYGSAFKYSPSLKRAAHWKMGQDVIYFLDQDQDGVLEDEDLFFDFPMTKSFRFF